MVKENRAGREIGSVFNMRKGLKFPSEGRCTEYGGI